VRTLLIEKKEKLSYEQQSVTFWEKVCVLLSSWEIYPILFIAAFLRLFEIDKVTFADDEARIFQMAHDAVFHGLWPIAGNQASLGSMHPPLAIYFLMIPAAFSANPIGGEILIALFNIAAVFLAYLFTRRYYGRLAGTIAALLYATSVGAWTYSRNIWAPNFAPFFVMLFLFALFRGVVERRKGWFLPALVLLGLLYQFHESSLLLIVPLAVALLFAFRTVRLRDVIFAVVVLLPVYAPYLVWELNSHFADLATILGKPPHPPVINLDAIRVYLFFLRPILAYPYADPLARATENHILVANAHSVILTTPLRHFHLFLRGAGTLAILLFLGGLVIAGLQILVPQWRAQIGVTRATAWKNRLALWWTEFRATPYRQGLILLLLWQVVPVVFLLRHSISVFAHYFIYLLPGQFILISLCIVKTIEFVQQHWPDWSRLARYGMGAIAALVILAQLIGSSTALIDQAAGNFDGQEVYPFFNDAHSLQNALQEADQLAQQRHIHRIYAAISFTFDTAMRYLAEQVKTPIELNDIWHCFILPDPSAGPVVFLAEPNNFIAERFLSEYTNATLVDEPQRLAEAPFKLYILTAKPAPAPVPHTFTRGLQLLSPAAQLFQSAIVHQQWIATRWRIPGTPPPRATHIVWLQFPDSAGWCSRAKEQH
jgi:4-amino-4-deoxy-L-arabinose transferase-like glycosyltransferase